MNNKDAAEGALPETNENGNTCGADRSRIKTSYVPYRGKNRGMTSRSFSSHSKRKQRSPYEEIPPFRALIYGKTLPPPQKKQILRPPKYVRHLPTGTTQQPIIVTKQRDVPKAVEYRERSKNFENFEKEFEQMWYNTSRRKNKNSPYKVKMSELRKSAIIETSRMIKQTQAQTARERHAQVQEYEKTVAREYDKEKSYPKGDLLHNREKFLRIIITE